MIFEGTKKSIFFGLGLTRAGETIPNTETLKLLSGFFDVSINTLLGSPRQLICQCCGMPLDDSTISNRMVLSMKNTVNGVIQTENSHMTILMI